MKTGIHPKYNENIVVTCLACKSTWNVGSTAQVLNVEVCSNCHHFWTGGDRDLTKAGRVDRFKKRAEKITTTATKVKKTK